LRKKYTRKKGKEEENAKEKGEGHRIKVELKLKG
jgi:hypothetical protein